MRLDEGVRGAGDRNRRTGGAPRERAEAEERAQFMLRMRARGIDDLDSARARARAARACSCRSAIADISARDIALPIGCGQTVAAALDRRRDDRRRSTSSLGPGAAKSAPERLRHRFARATCGGSRVVERFQSLALEASARIKAFGLGNVSVPGATARLSSGRRELRQGDRAWPDRAAGAANS